MAAIRMIILCALFALAMGFSIPEHQVNDPSSAIYEDQAFPEETLLKGADVLTRNVRSPEEPKRQFEARGEHHSRHGASAGVTYTHPVGKNVDLYGGVSRNFKYNDNSGHAGIRYKF